MPALCAVDHLVYAVTDLAAGTAAVAEWLGVEPIAGGPHVGRGTRNTLLGLGGGTYLEIIGPDPDQPAPAQARPFAIDDLTGPRLVTWAARTTDLGAAVDAARAVGHDPGNVAAMQRARPDGVLLSWRLTPPSADGALPFLIDWGTTPHPADSTPAGVELVGLDIAHPAPDRIRAVLDAWGLTQVAVVVGSPATLRAELAGPKGRLVLA